MSWLTYISFFALLILLATVAWAGHSFAPWVPCWKKDLPRIFALINLKPGEIFYDLGCGSGRTVFYAAKNFGAQAIGLEFALPLYFYCQGKKLLSRRRNVKFKWKNFFKENLADADAVYFFGLPKNIKRKLKNKLERELKPGARVVSYVFPIEEWQPVKVDKPHKDSVAVYLYIKQ